jgi:hypothetical protein
MLEPPFDLLIGIEDEQPEGFTSTDLCSELMEEFFRRLGIPTPDVFISLWVRRRNAPSSPLPLCYGPQYMLKPEHFDKVAIVCSGDFLNVMSKALSQLLRDGTPVDQHKHKVSVLQKLSVEEKIQQISRADETKGENAKYAEVRIYNAFHTEWFIASEPNSLPQTSAAESKDYDIEF